MNKLWSSVETTNVECSERNAKNSICDEKDGDVDVSP